jgi:hypothetical protein
MNVAAVIAFVRSPIGRYLLIAIAAMSLFVGLRAHFIHQGQLEGRQSAADQFTQQREKERTDDRQALTVTIAQANAQTAMAQKAIEAAMAREQAAAQTIQLLIEQRSQASKQVAGLQDSQLHDYITAALSIRKSDDHTLGYSFGEEREIAQRIIDDPLCRKQGDELAKQVNDVKDQVSEMQKSQAIDKQKYESLAHYTGDLERQYADLYNSFPRKGNRLLRIVSFGLKGKPKTIKAPDPKELLRGAKQ